MHRIGCAMKWVLASEVGASGLFDDDSGGFGGDSVVEWGGWVRPHFCCRSKKYWYIILLSVTIQIQPTVTCISMYGDSSTE
ncbi:hypothetical protein K402DRAFT_95912 [Aulographum hederae CBS 113979]|uniref:Uncharacterized protein n=1 Tax=Aulographum hederae CBS 113979 TaxID=1176131 RepID=A0A6G1GYD8_9PEZI|nr:hypothetical protein K402DRAFT_95912 [Aulographum hederae CBS 113979]